VGLSPAVLPTTAREVPAHPDRRRHPKARQTADCGLASLLTHGAIKEAWSAAR
jgi:hypothetical protein